MKKFKITYWISTGIFGLLILAMGIMYFVSPQISKNFDQLGFPDFLRIKLGIAKIVGAILLLIPFKSRFNEWVYAGFTINLVSAAIAHIAAGDPVTNIFTPIILLLILGTSYFTGHKINRL
jgi:uncharacterized membrane protein YphA (DoxX/SURF4 family)